MGQGERVKRKGRADREKKEKTGEEEKQGEDMSSKKSEHTILGMTN